MIKKGQKVEVVNLRLDGTPFMEGVATVVKVLKDMKNGFYACKVLFPGDDTPVFRWINEENQKDGTQ